MRDSLAGELADVVGRAHVITDRDRLATFETDWTGRFQGTAAMVVRPGSTDEVSGVLTRCKAQGVGVVTQGGNTGLVGGGVPRPDGDAPVVLSTIRLDELGGVDCDAMQVTAGAGVTLAAWQAQARDAGLDAPVDFASRESATIGGAVATNAGGSRVVRFGTMRSQVVGIEAVLADGSVVGSLSGLAKETAGIHWPSLLAGSEGTLAVVAAARLRLVPWYRRTATALVAVDDIAAAVSLLAYVRARLDSLDSIELVLPAAMALVAEHLGADVPVGDSGAYVLVECAAHDDPVDELAAAIESSGAVLDAAVSAEGPRRDHLVAFRDRITESIAAAGVPLKLDVAVPVSRLDELVRRATATVDELGGRLIAFGHLAEGNLHLNVLGAGDAEAITDTVLRTATELGGTISAEHGIGIAKAPWLGLVRSAADLAAARAVRDAFDPQRMLNAGVLET
ncbi:MAG: FAD-binding oxidoreductase [Acidimicrobiia bacterium]|nr:FAD-binding oxidoreductase [Acidimicrobiia bacterium]